MAAGQISTKATIALLGASVEVSTHLHMLAEINRRTNIAHTQRNIKILVLCFKLQPINDFILKDGLDCGHTDL